MYVNADKPHRWKSDIRQSVDFYNGWFLNYAPATYRQTRIQTILLVEKTFVHTTNLTNISPDILYKYPDVLPVLRMTTAPPLARDRLSGLGEINPSLILSMEKGIISRKMPRAILDEYLGKICQVILRLLDTDIFPWLASHEEPTETEKYRAATVVADRLCGSISDPLIRNTQEQRQLASIQRWLESKNYRLIHTSERRHLLDFAPGTFCFRFNVPVQQETRTRSINIPIDIVVMPHSKNLRELPLLIEAKSAGDFTNTNKRRKEEATKVRQLRNTYGPALQFALLLCGYFDSGYLGYEAAEGIDWLWEHRLDDLVEFGL